MLIQLFLVPLKSYQIGLFKWAIDKHLHLRCLVTITNDCLYILYLSVNLFVCVCACTLLEKRRPLSTAPRSPLSGRGVAYNKVLLYFNFCALIFIK